jgi:hypothetical protein
MVDRNGRSPPTPAGNGHLEERRFLLRRLTVRRRRERSGSDRRVFERRRSAVRMIIPSRASMTVPVPML